MGASSRVTALAPKAPAAPALDLAPVEVELAEPTPAALGAICARHPGARGYETCARCGDFVCSSCRRTKHRTVLCPDCAGRGDAEHEGIVPPGTEATIGHVLGRTFARTGAIAGVGFALAAIPAGLEALGSLGSWAMPQVPLGIAGSLVFSLAAAWAHLRAQAGLITVTRESAFGTPVRGFGAAFAAGSGRVWPLFVAQFFAGILVGGAALVGTLPLALSLSKSDAGVAAEVGFAGLGLAFAAYIFVRLFLVAPVVVLERTSGGDSLARSWGLTEGRGLTAFVVVLVLGLVTGGASAAAGVAELVSPLAAIGGAAVASMIGSVIAATASTSLYFACRAGEPTRG